ncbi:hypothetical protein DL771_002574 [Monosporascus sp. 5C6A]|nr:hypothetical protein DL771_002574 [Monosporascus sp. 5C6A]
MAEVFEHQFKDNVAWKVLGVQVVATTFLRATMTQEEPISYLVRAAGQVSDSHGSAPAGEPTGHLFHNRNDMDKNKDFKVEDISPLRSSLNVKSKVPPSPSTILDEQRRLAPTSKKMSHSQPVTSYPIRMPTTRPPHGGALASLRTILDATSSPETAEALVLALAFRFLALDALGMQHRAHGGLGALLRRRRDPVGAFKHHPTPLPRTATGYVPGGGDFGSSVGGARMSFDGPDPKTETGAFGFRGGVEMDELESQKSQAASPHPFEIPASMPPLPTSPAHRRSQSGAPSDASTIRRDRSTTPPWTPSNEGSVAGFDNVDLFEGASRSSSRATTTAVTGRSSFGEEPGFLQESHRGDARRHAELSESLAGRHDSVRAVMEDVPPRGWDIDSPFTMADATAYADLFSNPDRKHSTRDTGSQGNWT